MDIVDTIAALRAALEPHRRAGRSIGLVPTMGYLHHGHMELARRARADNDIVVLTIFVNPTQFGPNEDFSSYPRDLDRDLALCRENGVDLVFAPGVAEMYPEPIETHVEVETLSDILIGVQRPGHFRGVATVVSKLFNIAQPTRAYFGEKDFQQLAVIRRMVRDLCVPVEIVGVATVREPDGLAASSRNVRLSPEDRASASVVPGAMDLAARLAESGEHDPQAIVAAMARYLAGEPRASVGSIDIRDAETLGPIDRLGERDAVVLVTVRFGAVLLIDQRVLPAKREAGTGS